MEIYGGGGNTNRVSFSGASVCIFLKLNFILFIYLLGLKFKRIEFVQSV